MKKKPTLDSFDLSSFLPSQSRKQKSVPKDNKGDERAEKSNEPPKHIFKAPIPQTVTTQDSEQTTSSQNAARIYADSDEKNEVIPITNQVEMKGHERAISALAIDPSGTRMLSGGYDYKIRFWDFNGMDQGLSSFRDIEPFDGYQIKDIHFSPSGDQFLVATGANRPKIYDRDGFMLREYSKGDPYIMDMKHTKGHIAPLTCCQWHPTEKQTFMTAAGDSTIRIWDAENPLFQSYVVIAKSTGAGRLTAAITAASFNLNGKLVAGARQDGGLSMWDYASPNLRPTLHIPDAHVAGTDTSSIVFAKDDIGLASRGGDGTLKMWDMRMFKKPTAVVSGLESFFPETDVAFSPQTSLVVTGTSVKKGQGYGKLLFYDRYTLEKKHEVNVSQSSVIRIVWHPKLNQIFCGCSDASVAGFYDADVSEKGLLLAMARKAKRRKEQTYIPESSIHLPNALLVDDEPDNPFNRTQVRGDRFASRAVEVAYNMNLPRGETELLKQVTAASKQHKRDEDPREALLKYAKEAEENPVWVGHVYKKTQPKPIFDYSRDELEEQREVKRRK